MAIGDVLTTKYINDRNWTKISRTCASFIDKLNLNCVCKIKYMYVTNFDAPNANFDNLYLFGDAQGRSRKCGNPKYYNCKDPNKPKRIAENGAKSVEG
jgi:hypothetical protein